MVKRMKILHCADLHLDSRMSTNLNTELRKKRKAEILNTYQRMIEYAVKEKIEAILIAGDLFDTNAVSRTAMSAVFNSIVKNPGIQFYYLKGNHDVRSFLASMEEVPTNLHLFSDTWKSYVLCAGAHRNIVLTGVELHAENSSLIYPSLSLDSRDFNIVTLHGQNAVYQAKDKTEVISISDLKNKGIDYLALGHVHGYTKETLDARGTYCYPGCLEGRGFDECGEHGFVVLDVDEETGCYTHSFVPFAYRTLYTVPVDVSGCLNSDEMIDCVQQRLQKETYAPESLLKIELVGDVDVSCEKNLSYIQDRFASRFFFVKVKDKTRWKTDYKQYLLNESLKGEFVRVVMEDDKLSEDEKNEIIRCGLQALAGEELTE